MGEYVIVWQYDIRPETRAQFERAYATDGDWAAFFRAGEGYLGSRLLRDVASPDRYITLDRWRSEEAFERFSADRGAEYGDLDRLFEPLTLTETRLGAFVRDGL